MGLISDTPDMYMFECVACLSTYTGKPHELKELGWKRHSFARRVAPKRGEVLLCDDCSKRFAAIWKERKAA
jgi:hypothetical protein